MDLEQNEEQLALSLGAILGLTAEKLRRKLEMEENLT